MNTKTKNLISKCALGASIGAGPIVAYVGLSNMQVSDLGNYIFIGVAIFAFLIHLLFKDANFDTLSALKSIIVVLLFWLPFLFFIALLQEAYLAMFVCIGFFILTYLINLLLGIIKLNLQDQN